MYKRQAAWRSLRLLTIRNLKVRYSTSLLGYLWSVLDPLLMSLIYWFIFTKLMHRSLGEDPVSYTHLDVYKRQPDARRPRGSQVTACAEAVV